MSSGEDGMRGYGKAGEGRVRYGRGWDRVMGGEGSIGEGRWWEGRVAEFRVGRGGDMLR